MVKIVYLPSLIECHYLKVTLGLAVKRAELNGIHALSGAGGAGGDRDTAHGPMD